MTNSLRKIVGRAGIGVLRLAALTMASLAQPTLAAAPLAPTPSVDPTLPAPPGPFAYPSPAPNGAGYYVTCDLAAPTAACSKLASTSVPSGGTASTVGFGLATFLVNIPANYPLLQNWVPYTRPDPVTSSTSVQSPTTTASWLTKAVSGSGTTVGTSIAGNVPSSWSVGSGSLVEVSADITNSQGTLDTGFDIRGSDERPFIGVSGTVDVISTELGRGDTISFRVMYASTTPEAIVYDYTTGAYIVDEYFSKVLSATPRTNFAHAYIYGSDTSTINGNNGFPENAYYQPESSSSLDAWGSYAAYSDIPYYVTGISGNNYFTQPINCNYPSSYAC